MVRWEPVTLETDDGATVEARAPVIISASRSTDIPACYADWFAERLKRGYLVWMNPFNRRPSYISFDKCRAIVFWTKNAEPMMGYLDDIDARGIHYYFQYTVNDYEAEGLEPNIPPLDARIENFVNISEKIGKERVIWRFDPIILSDEVTMDDILSRIEAIGSRLHSHTTKLVFSFIDIAAYRKVQTNLEFTGCRELTVAEMKEFGEKISRMNKKWGLDLATCGEPIDLDAYGIRRNSCIDGDLLGRLFPDDIPLTEFLQNNNKKDKGQRKVCNCIGSKDIGQYNTCMNLCRYCYANRSAGDVRSNYERHLRNPWSETITGDVLKE
ncbi:DUF1848 domain-containing protein [Methanogenium organophilum]|uniref:DUF1848 domain-containing protein n=1 Tax=Methanogenium organophilum TaxID=2199 RepID=A0A9X9T8U0_METOG|nr:DUF1848 domain-containing protein [Methanogenium organophilum]WAI02529.1 DUF1848 domain-containing protein [Methanogenium organophilum]